MNLGRFFSRALLSCRTASLKKVADELVFHKPQSAKKDALNHIKMNVPEYRLHYNLVESVECRGAHDIARSER